MNNEHFNLTNVQFILFFTMWYHGNKECLFVPLHVYYVKHLLRYFRTQKLVHVRKILPLCFMATWFFSLFLLFFFFFPFVCNVKSFANVIVVCLQLLWVFFSVNFLDGQPKFIHDTCDQDRTCFQGHTGKCFRLCSVGFYSKRGWPTLTWYLCGTQDTPRNCFACSSSVG